MSPAVFYAIRLHFSCHPVGELCERPFFIQTNILCVILSERSESNFCEVQRSKRAKAQGEAVAGSIMRFRWLFQTNVTFFKKRQQNLFRDPFVALAPRFAPFVSLTTQTSTPLRSAQDDTAGWENIKFHYFFRTVEDACPYSLGFVPSAVERTK